MTVLKEPVQAADLKYAKHVPVIDCPDKVEADALFSIKVTPGEKIAHPNTIEHHIRWIQLYFLREGTRTPCQIGSFKFNGKSAESRSKGHQEVTASIKIGHAGTILALAYCNIHGLWQSSKTIKVV
jgi:superoxide reductase